MNGAGSVANSLNPVQEPKALSPAWNCSLNGVSHFEQLVC